MVDFQNFKLYRMYLYSIKSSVYSCFLDAFKAFDRVTGHYLVNGLSKSSHWLLLELLHFGIKHSLCVLNGEKLAQHISMF